MVEYRTTDTNELAPHPNMTSEDLKEFEDWAKEIEKDQPILGIFLVGIILVLIISLTTCEAKGENYAAFEAGFPIPKQTTNGDDTEFQTDQGALFGFEMGATISPQFNAFSYGLFVNERLVYTHGKNGSERNKNNHDKPAYVTFGGIAARYNLDLYSNWSLDFIGRTGPVYTKFFDKRDVTYGVSGRTALRFDWEEYFVSLGGNYFHTGNDFDSFGPSMEIGVKW